MSIPKITVILTSGAMGGVDETDVDLWSTFVATKIDDAFNVNATVEQARFGDGGEDRVTLHGRGEVPDVDCDEIRAWIRTTAWENFCGETWEAMRAAHDAAKIVEQAWDGATDEQISAAAKAEHASLVALGASDQGVIETSVRELVEKLVGARRGTLDAATWTWTTEPASRFEYDRNVELRGAELRVERYSRYQGTVDGRIVAFPAALVAGYDGEDLNAEASKGTRAEGDPPYPFGEVVLDWLERAEHSAGAAITSQIRVIEEGTVVQ